MLDSAQATTRLGRAGLGARRGIASNIWRTVRRSPLGAMGFALIMVLIFVGVFAPWIAPYGVNEFAGLSNEKPNSTFWFGTDRFGQDIYSRVLYWARISLQVSFFSVLGGTVLDLLIGSFSEFKGGWIDTVIQRVVHTAIAFPALILLLMIVRLMDPSLNNVIIVIGIGIIPGVARVIRGAALSERNNQ